jgi:hypothetical protein
MAFPAAGNDGTNKLICQRPPQIVLLAIDLDEDLIEAEGVTITTLSYTDRSGRKIIMYRVDAQERFQNGHFEFSRL